jgi:putative FmdB family regulatory protein
MPHYDYVCRECGHAFEVFQSMTEDKLTECPQCGGPVERQIGAGAGLLFKGSGFYVTDYRSDSYQRAARAEKGSASTSSSSGNGSGTKKNGSAEKSSNSSTSSSTTKSS